MSGLFCAALGETIALAVHLEDIDVVSDAIEQSAGESWLGKSAQGG